MLTTTKCREQETNIFQTHLFFPNKGIHRAAEQAPAWREPPRASHSDAPGAGPWARHGMRSPYGTMALGSP